MNATLIEHEEMSVEGMEFKIALSKRIIKEKLVQAEMKKDAATLRSCMADLFYGCSEKILGEKI